MSEGAAGAPGPAGAGTGAAAATTAARVLGGGVWSIAGKLLPQLYVLVVSVAAARFLEPGEFGRQSFIAFVELSLVMLLTAGLPVGLMRFIGETLGREQPDRVRGLIRWAWGVEMVAAAIGASLLIAVAAAGSEPAGAWVFAGVAAALAILHTVPSALLIGAQLWRSATIAGLVSGLVGSAATITVLAAGGGITGMFAVEAATSALILVWTTLLATRAGKRLSPSVAPAGELRRRVTRWTLVASVGVLLNFVVWRRSELFFLNAFSTNTEIAVYSIAFSVIVAMMRLPEALAEVSSPAIATLFGARQHDRIRVGYGRAARLSLVLALPLTVAGAVLGPAAITVVWGDAYEEAGPLLLIMLSTFPLLPLTYLARGALVGIGRQGVLIAASAIAAAVNIGLALLLIPSLDAAGAALANAGAQVAAGVPVIWAARRAFGPIDWRLGSLGRTVASSAVAGVVALAPVVLLGGITGLILGLGAGTAVFVAAATTVKILPADDAAWLGGAARPVCRRPGAGVRPADGQAVVKVLVVLKDVPLHEGSAPAKTSVGLLQGLLAHGLDVRAVAARQPFSPPGNPPAGLPVEVVPVTPSPAVPAPPARAPAAAARRPRARRLRRAGARGGARGGRRASGGGRDALDEPRRRLLPARPLPRQPRPATRRALAPRGPRPPGAGAARTRRAAPAALPRRELARRGGGAAAARAPRRGGARPPDARPCALRARAAR